MNPDPVDVLRTSDPLDASALNHLLARVAHLRAEVPETDPISGRARRGRRGVVAAAVAGGLVLAGGGALAAIVLERDDTAFPATPAGAADVRVLLARLTPAGSGPSFQIIPESARVVFSQTTPAGEYTVWRAGTQGRGTATLLSSPGGGAAIAVGPGRRLPEGPYVRVLGGIASPPPGRAAREVFGRVSSEVVRVRAVLKDGTRAPVMLEGGWFVFAQPFGHPKVVRLIAYDARGRAVARTDRDVF